MLHEGLLRGHGVEVERTEVLRLFAELHAAESMKLVLFQLSNEESGWRLRRELVDTAAMHQVPLKLSSISI